MALTLIVLALSLISPATHAHVCNAFGDGTSIGEARSCLDWRPDIVTVPGACTASTAGEVRSCIARGGTVSIAADITVTGCPALISVQGQDGLHINGNGHTILRTAGQRQCSLVDVNRSQDVSITDLTLDDDARVPACVVADNCPRMVHVRDSSAVSFDSVDVANGKGYVIYTSRVQGFAFRNGSLRNSGVLGMYIGHGGTPSTAVVISGSEFTDNSTNALAVLGASRVQITGNTFRRNHNRGQWPVAPQFGTGMTGGGQVYIARASDVLISGNIITDGACTTCRGGVHGIELSEPRSSTSVRNVTISGNTIIDNTGNAVYINAGAQVQGLVMDSDPTPPVTSPTPPATPTPPRMGTITPHPNWVDSIAIDGVCWITSTLDHDIGPVIVATPVGPKTVRQIMMDQGPIPRVAGVTYPAYNDVQCGNGPPNSARDEVLCPGRIDKGRAGCFEIGPRWDLNRLYAN